MSIEKLLFRHNEFTVIPPAGGVVVFTTPDNQGFTDLRGQQAFEAPCEYHIMLGYVKCLWQSGEAEKAVEAFKPLMAFAQSHKAIAAVADNELQGFVQYLSVLASDKGQVTHWFIGNVPGNETQTLEALAA